MSPLMSQIAQEENLHAAWRKVRSNGGAPGVDALTLADYEEELGERLGKLGEALRSESYIPVGLRRVRIPKKNGGERELAIPTVEDRIAQRAFINVLEPLLEPQFLPCSFGYRPGRGVHDATERVLAYRAAGADWVLDADVQDFFPSVDHELLQTRLAAHLSDRAVLRTIALWLEAGALGPTEAPPPSLISQVRGRIRDAAGALWGERGAWEELPPPTLAYFGQEAARLAWDYRRTLLPLLSAKGMLVGGGAALGAAGAVAAARHVLHRRRPRFTGAPQGGPLSPLLSNLYLHSFDLHLTRLGLRLVRYADDFVICCRSEGRAQQARAHAAEALEELGLTLHPEKTRILSCRDPLTFLGHDFDDDGAYLSPNPPLGVAMRQATTEAIQALRKKKKT